MRTRTRSIFSQDTSHQNLPRREQQAKGKGRHTQNIYTSLRFASSNLCACMHACMRIVFARVCCVCVVGLSSEIVLLEDSAKISPPRKEHAELLRARGLRSAVSVVVVVVEIEQVILCLCFLFGCCGLFGELLTIRNVFFMLLLMLIDSMVSGCVVVLLLLLLLHWERREMRTNTAHSTRLSISVCSIMCVVRWCCHDVL